MKKNILNQMMYAKSVAIIGASNKTGSVGNEIIKRLLESNYNGQIYPVNLKESQIEGLKCYKSVTEIRGDIDLAVIAVPPLAVLDVVDQCHKAKISGVVVITAGFKEVGSDGAMLEEQLLQKIKKYKMRMIGPNCLGVINCQNNMSASFNPTKVVSGNVGFASQSGAMIASMINLAAESTFGFNQVVSLGNQADVDFLDFVQLWEDDENIKVIMLYVESIANPEKFKEITSRVSKKKPIIMLKAGRSEVGMKATMSHTGSLAGDDISINALIESCGVIRVINIRDLVNTVALFSLAPIPQGKSVAILTNAGGPGIVSADSLNDYKLPLANLTSETKSKLKAVVLPQASVNNPVDIVASATLEQYLQSAEILLSSNEVDALMCIYLYITNQHDKEVLEGLNNLQQKFPHKPIISVFQTTNEFYQNINNKGCYIPVYKYAIDGISAFNKLIEYKSTLSQTNEVEKIKVKKRTLKSIIDDNRKNNIKACSTIQSLKFFEEYNIPVAKYEVVSRVEEATAAADRIGYPVVLKISSTKVTHKTDVGGVVTNIENEAQLLHEWNALIKRLDKNGITDSLDGIIIMQQVKMTGREFVAGIIKKDIGHLAMFGIGGIFVEVLNEVKFRPCPLNEGDVNYLIGQEKIKKLLGDVRKLGAVDEEEIKQILRAINQMVVDFPEIEEVDVNPILIDKNTHAITVDARIIL